MRLEDTLWAIFWPGRLVFFTFFRNICRMRHKMSIETGIYTMNSIRSQTMDEDGNPRLGLPPGVPGELRKQAHSN